MAKNGYSKEKILKVYFTTENESCRLKTVFVLLRIHGTAILKTSKKVCELMFYDM